MSETHILRTEIVYEGFFRFLKATVALPDGAVVEREVLESGGAVAVLPYDPERRVAMLITQPRPGAFYRGEQSPLEAIAGALDGIEPHRRIVEEAMEEGGLRLGTLEPVANIWSPVKNAEARRKAWVLSKSK
ncbi:hypothetical protein B2G71_22085 [Novosphingobium sp. PC22D]|uniref:hypothetical protein n=1 Tax=Novosphingobium sp. PC22D TaxID=1962403 RepID=UPI000BF188AD|nr:hypothetical protein [Novosphingobium sp. PC22D]PEQ10451.1 hypothetical protein B2G71_22085 [Novosphingobium sp. PC22D]